MATDAAAHARLSAPCPLRISECRRRALPLHCKGSGTSIKSAPSHVQVPILCLRHGDTIHSAFESLVVNELLEVSVGASFRACDL